MATKKKMLQAAAGNAGGEALNVEDVFSTYLFETNNQTITNGIDLSTEGGLVWLKGRHTVNHLLFDTERGVSGGFLSSSTTASQSGSTYFVDAFNTNGFDTSGFTGTNDYASWTFRKAPKFFDVVTYTGDASDQVVSHSLGSTPGCIIIKPTSGTGDWIVYHRGLTNNGANFSIKLNTTAAQVNQGGLVATDSTFTLYHTATVNTNNVTYVAYLFAHNDGDGGFNGGDIIKCGSYTGNGSTTGPVIDLGFEPQWVMIKETDATGNWQLFDSMRGMVADGVDARIAPNLSNAEDSIQSLTPTATGFKINTTSGNLNTNNSDHIYIAIRRGTKVPESGTEVFAVDNRGSTEATNAGTSYYSGFPVDFTFGRNKDYAGGDTAVYDRLRGDKNLFTNLTNAEGTVAYYFDSNQGFWGSTQSTNTSQYSWMWKRAPGFFDVVAYTGSNSDQNVSHNLGAVPEMMWVKCRSGFTENWTCYHKDLGNTKEINLNTTGVPTTSNAWANTTPTDSVFTVDGDYVPVSKANVPYIAYLFASLDGVSKVGSYTGNGGTLSVDCGFTSGARFVLFRNITTSNGDWTFADTERGIVSGNDSALNLNDTSAAITNEDFIDPNSSGFTVVNASGFVDSNINGHTYLFYAIA